MSRGKHWNCNAPAKETKVAHALPSAFSGQKWSSRISHSLVISSHFNFLGLSEVVPTPINSNSTPAWWAWPCASRCHQLSNPSLVQGDQDAKIFLGRWPGVGVHRGWKLQGVIKREMVLLMVLKCQFQEVPGVIRFYVWKPPETILKICEGWKYLCDVFPRILYVSSLWSRFARCQP